MKARRIKSYKQIKYAIEQNLAVGQYLMDQRIACNVSRDSLGSKIGVSGSTIFSWEMGRTNWTDERIEMYCHALDISIPSTRTISRNRIAALLPENNKAA